jgi:hypothetical protein
MNPRQRMRISNIKAKDWMLEKGFTDIWFKKHGKWHDKIYKNKLESYSALDLWNLFDGACWFGERPVFFQVKTNGWANKIKLGSFIIQKSPAVLVLSINVKGSPTHGWKVWNQTFERTNKGYLESSL